MMHKKHRKTLNLHSRGESNIIQLHYSSQHDDYTCENDSKHQSNTKETSYHGESSHAPNIIMHYYSNSTGASSSPLQYYSNRCETTMNDLYTNTDDDNHFLEDLLSPTTVPSADDNSFTQSNANDIKNEPKEMENQKLNTPIKVSEASWESSYLYVITDVIWKVLDTPINMYKNVDNERLPWKSDFMNLDRMSMPANSKEMLSRINLNIPYYALNYMELSCVITLPFLYFYNFPYFVVYSITCMLLYSVLVNGIESSQSHNYVCFCGLQISYHNLGHSLLFAYGVIFIFSEGVKTWLLVTLMNLFIIIPHALWRTPTYFDDEKLEKCRPRLVRNALMLLMLFLVYLEGDLLSPEDEMRSNENLRNAEKERERLRISFEDT
ncbi:unnamed protein product [Phytomonas sp. Hart1]|nr:unnamed protein product [Phytomonas sp. Hart1]|eukprot:CCW66243.1 unnamed protein product [Phytomonas sp. isolate Hart1]